MIPNPLVGVVYHWLGGFASASFYVPYRAVRGWSWEIFWLTGGLFSWLFAPWLFAALQTNDLPAVLRAAPTPAIIWPAVFGALWGFGGLTYGLTMRYLGLSLGMAVVLGLCTVFGTLIPPLVQGDFAARLLDTASGKIILCGIVVTLAGIFVIAAAGAQKDASLSDEKKTAAIAEFDFRKGIAVVGFSGIMSSCFAFGLAAGEPVKAISAAHGTYPLWTGLPVLCLVMAGGLATNGVWCLWLIVRNRSAAQWLGRASACHTPLVANFLLCGLAGTAWYFQFFFYTMGESQMGRFGFSSWALHMASIIIFGTLWGFALHEWRDTSRPVRLTMWSGIAILIAATVTIGYGNMIAG